MRNGRIIHVVSNLGISMGDAKLFLRSVVEEEINIISAPDLFNYSNDLIKG